ncbi:MAG: ZIP family metal transporter [Methylophilaceae bacterium]|jgi:zinc and cadmium transporter|uniref:ZIP family metal transporter n=1 Tax=Methylobacillus sp. MM3 TaxID=1848039 RepID=UPI0007DF2892|nr:ZIP family metal transporter [Methylobacillus sp. MM3]OAJ71190.1 ZIP zinc transporter [Methylobacillus sp. MM3]
MSVFSWILVSSLFGGVLSVTAAGLVALNARTAWIPMLISYAIGALLGAVFLEILPHAFELSSSMDNMAATVLFGILLFFVLEKLVLWRHCHGDECEAHAAPAPVHDHGHDHGRSGMMIMIGDTFHNFVDGILIAAAFMTDFKLGAVTALAIIAHEIPQEVGDFLILLHSGYTKRQAFIFNLLSSLATLVGGVIAYFALQTVQNWIPTILGLAAASMIYVAVADLIPGLHKRPELRATVQQVTLIGLGIGSIWLVKFLLGHHA